MTATPAPQSKIVSWFWATRPFSLSASVAPVLVGTALAATDGPWSRLLFALALTGSVAIQIGTKPDGRVLGPPEVGWGGQVPRAAQGHPARAALGARSGAGDGGGVRLQHRRGVDHRRARGLADPRSGAGERRGGIPVRRRAEAAGDAGPRRAGSVRVHGAADGDGGILRAAGGAHAGVVSTSRCRSRSSSRPSSS